MSYLNNPVQRLHFVASALANFPVNRTEGNRTVDISVRDAVAGSFGCDGDAEVLRVVSEILVLPEVAADALRGALRGPKLEAHLGWHSPIENAFMRLANISTKHVRFVEAIPPGTLKELQLAVFEVPDASDPDGYGDPHEDSIARASADLESLASTIIDAEIHEQLKRFLLDHIDRMRIALREYRIRGAEGVNDATDCALGAIFRATQVHNEWFSPDDDSKKTMQKFFDLVGKVADVGGVVSLGMLGLPWVQGILPG